MAALEAVREANAAVDLTGRFAVVVGGTAGLGRGLALRLAKAGCSVTIVGRNEDRANEVISKMASVTPASGKERPGLHALHIHPAADAHSGIKWKRENDNYRGQRSYPSPNTFSLPLFAWLAGP